MSFPSDMTAPPAGALEACPCCGGEAATSTARTTDRDYIRLNKRDTGYGVNCISCGLTNRGIAIGYATEADAIAAWNRRTHGPALLAALRLREWRPIESAPKSVADGSRVEGIYLLGFIPDEDSCDPQSCMDTIWWEPLLPNTKGRRGKWCAGKSDIEAHPTHWMPLPAPPTADELARVLEEGE